MEFKIHTIKDTSIITDVWIDDVWYQIEEGTDKITDFGDSIEYKAKLSNASLKQLLRSSQLEELIRNKYPDIFRECKNILLQKS